MICAIRHSYDSYHKNLRRSLQSIVVVFCLFVTTTTSCVAASEGAVSGSSSSSSTSTSTTTSSSQQFLSPYEAVRALDSYGNAVQLRHAQAAADVQGRTVIAMDRSKEEDEIWIFSVPPAAGGGTHATNVPHHHRKEIRGKEEEPAILTGMVQQLSLTGVGRDVSGSTTTTSSTSETTIAIVSTGVAGDCVWLTKQLRAFCGSLWERYDSINPSPMVMAQAVAFAKRLFWGYPSDTQWTIPAIKSVMKSNGSWARPMGLRTLVLSCDQTPQMQLVEPSGIVRKVQGGGIACMGKYSEAVQARLEEKLVPKLSRSSQKQIQNAVFDALRHVMGYNATPEKILLEIVSSRGIDRQLISRT